MSIEKKINNLLKKSHMDGLYRKRSQKNSKFTINFSSNDYLSLSHDPLVQRGFIDGFGAFPAGSCGSMLVSGHHQVHKELENKFSEFLNVDDCVVLGSGYVANLSMMHLFKKIDVHPIIDKAVHASVYDGLQAQNLNFTRYSHQNLSQMMRKIQQVKEDKILLTEGIFSMSGQIASIGFLGEYCSTLDIPLIIDEAHSFGVLGHQGRGAVDDAGLTQQQAPLRVIPLGKAMAAHGAIIAGQRDWIDALIQCARPYAYSTGISPAYAYGIGQTLERLIVSDEKRDKLFSNTQYFRNKVQHSKWIWRKSDTAIQQLQTGCPDKALQLSNRLKKAGILCLPMRPPTVQQQETGLRVTLNTNHEFSMIDKFFDVVESI